MLHFVRTVSLCCLLVSPVCAAGQTVPPEDPRIPYGQSADEFLIDPPYPLKPDTTGIPLSELVTLALGVADASSWPRGEEPLHFIAVEYGEEVVKHLQEALANRGVLGYRYRISEGLAYAGGREAVSTLRELYEGSRDPRFKADLSLALASTGRPEDRAYLQQMLDEKPRSRMDWALEVTAHSLSILKANLESIPDDPGMHVRNRILHAIFYQDISNIDRSDRFFDGLADLLWERSDTGWTPRAVDSRPAGVPGVTCKVFISSDGERALAVAGFHFGPLDGKAYDILLKNSDNRWIVTGINPTLVF